MDPCYAFYGGCVQNELSQELKLQELQETLKKVEEKANLERFLLNLSSPWKSSRWPAQSLKSDYQATTNDIETELNKAKELTDSYDSAVKDAKDNLPQTLESDPDPEHAAKMAAVVEDEKPEDTTVVKAVETIDAKAKNSNQIESEK
ncbi:hypothetical protein MASR2M36_38230 [Providencia sp.]